MPDIGSGTSNTKGINTGSFLGPAPSSDGEAEKEVRDDTAVWSALAWRCVHSAVATARRVCPLTSVWGGERTFKLEQDYQEGKSLCSTR